MDINHEGSCSNLLYSNDYSIVFAVETGDSLDEYSSGVLDAALCAALGAYTGHPATAGLVAIVCFSISFFFLDGINPSGAQLSIGAWDCHEGWVNEPSVCTGAIGDYTVDAGDLVRVQRIPVAHLSMGSSVPVQ